jgi:dienelactone hydrolase
MDDLKRRWARLEPHLTIVGPDDDRPRPAVLLFHGCGGLRSHLPRYAEAAKAAGWRAFIVDSYGPRGWGRAFTLTAVCTGLAFRGYERAGDVLAAIQGISAARTWTRPGWPWPAGATAAGRSWR